MSVCICAGFWHRGWSCAKEQKHSNIDASSVEKITVEIERFIGGKFHQHVAMLRETCVGPTPQCSGYGFKRGIEPRNLQHPFPCMLQCGLVEQNNDGIIATRFAQFVWALCNGHLDCAGFKFSQSHWTAVSGSKWRDWSSGLSDFSIPHLGQMSQMQLGQWHSTHTSLVRVPCAQNLRVAWSNPKTRNQFRQNVFLKNGIACNKFILESRTSYENSDFLNLCQQSQQPQENVKCPNVRLSGNMYWRSVGTN